MRYRFSLGNTWYLAEVTKKDGNNWYYNIIDSCNKHYIGDSYELNYSRTVAHGWTIEEDKEHKVLEILRSYESKRNKVQK